jgi:hypothetical protein
MRESPLSFLSLCLFPASASNYFFTLKPSSMKEKLFLMAIIALPVFMNAQSLSPQVISSTGGYATSPSGSLSYTVGEMTMVQTFSAGNTILTQGFQQPNDNITGLLDLTTDEFGSFVIYPNPAVDNLWFGFQFPESGRVSISLTNSLGQKVADVYEAQYSNGKTVEPLSVSSYAAGVYFLTTWFTSAQTGKTHIVSKKFQVIN